MLIHFTDGFPNVPHIFEDKISIADTQFEEGRKHTVVNVYIPFGGDGIMFRMYHTSRPMVDFGFDQHGQELVTQFDVRPDQVEQLPKMITERLSF